MMILRRKTGEVELVEHDEQLGRKMPDTQAERDEVYERIRAEVEALGRGHDQPEHCAPRRAHPTFRGRRRK
jgi:hypothetical protein